MTKQQFTPEYIAFMQSDEARALQRLWEPAVGDVFLVHATGATEVILGWDARDTGVWTIQLGIGAGSTKHFWTRGTICGPGAVWLPTLWQLLRIIEGAEGVWELQANVMWPGRPDGERYRASVCDRKLSYGTDLLLATAKLAVKAVEGKG